MYAVGTEQKNMAYKQESIAMKFKDHLYITFYFNLTSFFYFILPIVLYGETKAAVSPRQK